MSFVDEANTVFTVLTFVANLALVALAIVGVVALCGRSGRAAARRVLDIIGPHAPVLAMIVAVVATAGSLYYSQIVHYLPCELCWFQRICMYPLSAILVVGVIRRRRSGSVQAAGRAPVPRRDAELVWYATPFVVFGAPVSLYHWLVERVPSFASESSCSVFVPCTVPYFEELGYVTLAFMALSAFLLIGALLVVTALYDRGASEGAR